MAHSAVLTIGSIVFVVVLVACITIGWGAFIDIVDMAGGAGDIDVRAGQLEGSQVVIETGPSPAGGCMAAGAILAQRALMLIILLMAGIAGSWCALVNIIDMAGCAGHCRMCACQFESSQIVIETGPGP